MGVTIISWVSALTVLTGFLLVSQNKIAPNSRIYLLINLLGSMGLGISAFYTKTYVFVLLNTVWGLVALVTLIKVQFNNQENVPE